MVGVDHCGKESAKAIGASETKATRQDRGGMGPVALSRWYVRHSWKSVNSLLSPGP